MSHSSCLTILLIDNCAEDREAYRRFLEQDSLYTYRFLEFETGTPALKWCQREIPDIILLNFLSLDGDGLKFIQQFRECHSNTQTAVIMLTGQADEITAVRAMKSGVQDYLVKKKLTPEVLQGAIHHAIERMDLTRQLEQSREQQQLIAAIALRIRQSLKLEEILHTTATEVRQFLKADRVVIYQFQPDMSGTIKAESVLPGWTVALGQQILDTCFQKGAGSDYRQGKKRAIDDIYQAGLTNCHLQLLEQFEVKANLVVPILVKEQLWGLLIAHQCSAPRHWQSVELDLLDQLAVQIAIAIQQGSAYQQLEAELAERQRTQAALKASEEKLKLTLSFAGIGYWEWNPITHQIFASENAIRCFGSDLSDVNWTYEKWLNQLYPEDQKWVEPELRQAIATQTDYAVEYRVVWQDGSIHWVSAKGRGVYDATGKLLRMLGVLIDITERKLSEEERRRAQMLRIELHLLEQILEVGLAGYWDWNIPGNQEYLSLTFKQMFGYEDHELPNTPESWQSLVFPEDLPGVLELFEQHVQSRGQIPFYNEVRYRHKDGSTVWVICSGRVIAWDRDGNPLRMIGCHINITQRKQAEAQLLAIANLQQAILDGTDYAIIFNNSNGIQTFNAAAQKMLGYTADEVVRQINPTTFHDPEELNQRAAELSLKLGREIAPGREFFTIVTQDGSTYENEWTYIRKDGSRFPVFLSVKILQDLEGNNIGFLGIAKDITQQKQIETALRDSELRYANLAEAAPVAIFRLDALGNCIYANDRWSEMTGRPTQEALGVGWIQALHPEDAERLGREWSLKFEQGHVNPREFYQSEGRHLRPDGSINWFYVQVLPEINTNDTIIGYIGTLTDISDHKLAEEQLHHLSERLTIAIRSGGFGIWEYDFVQARQIWDDRMYELYGVSKTDFNGSFDAWFNCLYPEDRPYLLETMEQVIQGNQEYNVEFRIVQPSGEIRFLKGYGILKRDQQGELVRMIGVNYDISDRKQAEQELIHNRDLREAIFNESADAIFLVDPQTLLTLDCNRQAVELFEAVDKAELVSINGQTLQLRPFTASETDAIVRDMQSKGVWSREIEYITLQGKIFWGNIAAKTITVAGRTMNLVRIADISERKEAQEALAKYAHEVEDLYDNAPCGYYSLDSEGRLLKVNETELQWLGYTREEMIGQTLVNFLTQASRLSFEQNYPRFKKQGSLKDLELDMVCKDGTVFPVLVSATAVKDAEGNYLYSRTTLFDIRERKQTAQELEESRKMLQTVLDTFPQRVFWKDRQSRFIGCNPAFIRHSQLTTDEIIGKTDFELPWAKLAHLYCTDDMMVMTTRIPKLGYEEPFEGANGEQLWLRTNKVPLTNSAGEVIGILVSHEDITERKQAEAQLRQTNEQLANANMELARATRLKDEFLANMSHELRTPLNAILGMSEGLQESVFGSINERQVKAIATIERSGRHLLELINDILDLSKIESGKLELQLSDVSVRSLCDTSIAFVKQMALKKNIHLITHISEHIDSIQVDDRRLRQVLINLLSNAVKFTPDGGSVTLEVRLEGEGGTGEERQGEQGRQGKQGENSSPLHPSPCPSASSPLSPSSSPNLCFHIIDTGIGIAAGEIGKLFQPFIQLDSSLNRQYSGTGLGLALVQKIVALHGGTVLVRSEVGEGSCFTVYIPYHASDNMSTTQVTTLLPSYHLPAENAQVLIIEDSVAAADQITRYFSEMGMQPIIYPKGEGAVEEVLRVQPALIILDLQLPNLSGWEVLNQLKTNPKTKYIPAIIISVVDERSKGLAQGAFEYLVKPITRTQLQTTIDKLQHSALSNPPNLIGVPEAVLDTPLILLAEDNQANIDTMSGYLEGRGYHLILANNGQQAIDLVRVQRPDLIVMDIQMPGMDGLEAMRRIRNDQQFVHIPIIALTALAMPGDRETCLAAGANEYLTKPVKLKQLVSTIQQLLSR
ncbi:PAS domain S-box protein [Nostoc edaphicum CCNP1411]|uniref:histidine kinase n=1 Tax=Nostoc edaphicum CCNP1411 TaxID=1472755 RepID=A0A7D7QEI2_9NOSO|nr:PAS domain S-box protein [Nostoc edaphicum]QMS86862.1 PAS domain S-box protein [Nostoc edaphicum CCNP1411]